MYIAIPTNPNLSPLAVFLYSRLASLAVVGGLPVLTSHTELSTMLSDRSMKVSRQTIPRLISELTQENLIATSVHYHRGRPGLAVTICDFDDLYRWANSTEQHSNLVPTATDQASQPHSNLVPTAQVPPTRTPCGSRPPLDRDRDIEEDLDKNKEKVLRTKEKAKPFIKPTIEEIRSHILEKQYRVDAEKFCAYYESNGWRVGRNPMKSWQASLVTWNKNHREFQGGASSEGPRPKPICGRCHQEIKETARPPCYADSAKQKRVCEVCFDVLLKEYREAENARSQAAP